MRNALILTLALSLAACSDGAPDTPETEASATPAPEPSQTADSDSDIALRPIAYDQFSPLIEPGLGCSFEDADGNLLFVATAPDERDATAEGVIDSGGGARVVEADATGGYNSLVEGGSFTGASGTAVTITRDGGEGTPEGIETTAWPARLVVRGEGGGQRAYDGGQWACGA